VAHHKWETLKNRMSPERRARIDASVQAELASMPLAEIRKAIGLTQVELAGKLDAGQGTVSKIENAADMYLTTLRKYIEALGGELYLTARFPDGRSMNIDTLTDMTQRRAS
jgi:transcriptional regulator with XRE-family HTH domain